MLLSMLPSRASTLQPAPLRPQRLQCHGNASLPVALRKRAHTPAACPHIADGRSLEQDVLVEMEFDPRYASYSMLDAEDDAIFCSYKFQLCDQVRRGCGSKRTYGFHRAVAVQPHLRWMLGLDDG